jgi:glycosyltransferase involved in cell wall biosynthesis
MNRVVFLYTELADYFLKCLESCGTDFEFLVIHWPTNKEAPFQFIVPKNTKLLHRESKSKAELIETIIAFQPQLICCSGWIDKDYIAIAKALKSKHIKTCIALDNHWNDSIKQNIARVISRITIKKYFDFAWVPGSSQSLYAKKLGFKENQIKLGYYCADTNRFSNVFKKRQENAEVKNKHICLFVARYVSHKGIYDLWEAFIETKKTQINDWELWCIGTGAEWDNRIEHPSIKHLGFKQPNELTSYLIQADVYVLPSHFEPWGVSVHEMALSGLPLLLSNKVGAAEKFLIENKNGYVFEAGNILQLTAYLQKMTTLTDMQLREMAVNSHDIGLSLSHKDWKNTLSQLVA